MVGWHHRLDGHEFEQTPGDGEGQESLACCSPWGRKESATTQQLDNSRAHRTASLRMGLSGSQGLLCWDGQGADLGRRRTSWSVSCSGTVSKQALNQKTHLMGLDFVTAIASHVYPGPRDSPMTGSQRDPAIRTLSVPSGAATAGAACHLHVTDHKWGTIRVPWHSGHPQRCGSPKLTGPWQGKSSCVLLSMLASKIYCEGYLCVV